LFVRAATATSGSPIGAAAALRTTTTWIALLREPVDRAFSHYNMLRRFEVGQARRERRALAPSSSFEAAIEPEVRCYEAQANRSLAEAFDVCLATPVAGSFASLEKKGKLKYLGSLNGLLSVGVVAPQLRRAKGLHDELLVVSQRALFDDGEAVVDAVLGALPGKKKNTERTAGPVKRYESLSDHADFGLHDGATFLGHRSRIDAATLARLDGLLERHTRELADLLLSPTTDIVSLGLHHDRHWLHRPTGEVAAPATPPPKEEEEQPEAAAVSCAASPAAA